MSKLIFTTSWDDGHILDLKLAELLRRYNIAGTFYISKTYLNNRVTDEQISEISGDFEIGAHTIHHPELTAISPDEARQEIVDSKRWLESLIKKPVTAFCYPRGDFNPAIRGLVKGCGFNVARTVEAFKTGVADPFEMGTTIHVYPYPWRWRNANWPKFRSGILGFQIRKFRQALKFGIPLWRNYSWLSMATAAFQKVQREGGMFHLWGHSWEIEKYGMWSDLEKFLNMVSKQPNVEYKNNSEVIIENGKY